MSAMFFNVHNLYETALNQTGMCLDFNCFKLEFYKC